MEELKCVPGCNHFTGGEVKHHKDCPYYPDSMSQRYDRQNEMIGELTLRLEFLQDSQNKRQDWLRKAKGQAGYDDSVSFDKVWAEVLSFYKSNKIVVGKKFREIYIGNLSHILNSTEWIDFCAKRATMLVTDDTRAYPLNDDTVDMAQTKKDLCAGGCRIWGKDGGYIKIEPEYRLIFCIDDLPQDYFYENLREINDWFNETRLNLQ